MQIIKVPIDSDNMTRIKLATSDEDGQKQIDSDDTKDRSYLITLSRAEERKIFDIIKQYLPALIEKYLPDIINLIFNKKK